MCPFGTGEGDLRMKLARLILSFLIIGSLPMIYGCSVEDLAQTNPDDDDDGDGDGDDDDGEIINKPSTENFEIKVNTSTQWRVTISKNGDGSTPCRAVAGEDLFCVVDMPELDMFFRGFTMNDALPGSMCKYRSFRPYFYNIAPVGFEPTQVFYQTDGDDALVAPSATVPDALAAAVTAANALGGLQEVDIWYRIKGDWFYHAQLYGEKAAGPDAVRCPFDYTNVTQVQNGRNCCKGKYYLMTRDGEGTVANSNAEWGGSIANCFEGPGIDSYEYKFENGLPRPVVTNVDPDNGLLSSFTVAAPISKDELDQPQIYAANFYVNSEHSNDVPAAMKVAENYGPSNSAHYVYECLDAHSEIVASIRVVAREWNLLAEYEKLLAGTVGNSDTLGNETPPTNSEGDSEADPADPINDFCDWKDITSVSGGGGCRGSLGSDLTAFGFANLTSSTVGNFLMPNHHEDYLGFAD